MASLLEEELAAELATWESVGRRRSLGAAQSLGVDFSSNDYLGLATNAVVIEAARQPGFDFAKLQQAWAGMAEIH